MKRIYLIKGEVTFYRLCVSLLKSGFFLRTHFWLLQAVSPLEQINYVLWVKTVLKLSKTAQCRVLFFSVGLT